MFQDDDDVGIGVAAKRKPQNVEMQVCAIVVFFVKTSDVGVVIGAMSPFAFTLLLNCGK